MGQTITREELHKTTLGTGRVLFLILWPTVGPTPILAILEDLDEGLCI
jgi:hypothetical protein